MKTKRHRRDLTGERYGKLKVISEEFTKSKHDRSKNKDVKPEWFWVCLCDCGKKTWVRTQSLTSGWTKSCGCFVIEKNSKPSGVSAFNCWFLIKKHDAKKAGQVWELTKKQTKKIALSNCHYCGIPPHRKIYMRKSTNGTIEVNGIDRQDNNEGYVKKNCVPCCWNCNSAKRNLPLKDWLAWLDRIVKFRTK